MPANLVQSALKECHDAVTEGHLRRERWSSYVLRRNLLGIAQTHPNGTMVHYHEVLVTDSGKPWVVKVSSKHSIIFSDVVDRIISISQNLLK